MQRQIPGLAEPVGSNPLLAACLHAAADPIAVLAADGAIAAANAPFLQAFGFPSDPTGQTLEQVAATAPAIAELAAAISSGIERPLIHLAEGGPYLVACSAAPGGYRAIGLARQPSLGHALDGLDAAARRIDASLARGETLSLLYVDVDKLDRINDSLGYAMGDALLRVVRDRIAATARGSGETIPLGADESLVVLAGDGEAAAAAAMAADLVELLSRPALIRGHLVGTGVSIGAAAAPRDASNGAVLIRRAKLALHAAQEAGGSTWRLFDAEFERRLADRRQLEFDLRRAIKTREFRMFYQAQARASDGEIAGFEALIRWAHPDRGVLAPGAFIDAAEAIGLMPQLGAWVLETACRDAAKWPARLGVSVNVSPSQFMDGRLVDHIRRALERSGLPAPRLELEITENTLLTDTAENLATLRSIRELGCRIALDDFGTGYSSLSYLSLFPFNRLKLDRSFVGRLSHDRHCSAIARTVADLGLKLGMDTVAEGVENREQLAAVNAQGFDVIQGYLISKPVPPDRLNELIPELGMENAA